MSTVISASREWLAVNMLQSIIRRLRDNYRGNQRWRRTVDLGKIAVKENSIVLRDAEVTAVRAEVKVMEDTVEYNADSYKTQPNAVVEDLLKRLREWKWAATAK